MSPGLSRNTVQTICIIIQHAPIPQSPNRSLNSSTPSQLCKPFPPVEGRFSWALLGMHHHVGFFAYHIQEARFATATLA